MKSTRPEYPVYAPETREQWRAWLEDNHASAAGVWVVFGKKNSGILAVTYVEAVEEALCFGWIDSVTRRLDEQRTIQMFTPRKPGGTWAKSNKERVARLIAEGRMTPAGMAKIEQAQADGSWNALDEFEGLAVPEDLAAALAANPEAARNFEAFPPGARRTYSWWVTTAKRPETRAKRITESVRLIAQNVKNPQPVTRRESGGD